MRLKKSGLSVKGWLTKYWHSYKFNYNIKTYKNMENQPKDEIADIVFMGAGCETLNFFINTIREGKIYDLM